jgi:hypothetical protein
MQTISSFTQLAQMGQEGLKRKAALGFHRGPVPFGFTAIRTKAGVILQEDQREQALLKGARKLYESGSTVREVQDWLHAQGARSKRGAPLSRSSVYILITRRSRD